MDLDLPQLVLPYNLQAIRTTSIDFYPQHARAAHSLQACRPI